MVTYLLGELITIIDNPNTPTKKLSQVFNLRELQKVPEAGLEPAQPLLAKGF